MADAGLPLAWQALDATSPHKIVASIDKRLVRVIDAPRLVVVGPAFGDNLFRCETVPGHEIVVVHVCAVHDAPKSDPDQFAEQFQVQPLISFLHTCAVGVARLAKRAFE